MHEGSVGKVPCLHFPSAGCRIRSWWHGTVCPREAMALGDREWGSLPKMIEANSEIWSVALDVFLKIQASPKLHVTATLSHEGWEGGSHWLLVLSWVNFLKIGLWKRKCVRPPHRAMGVGTWVSLWQPEPQTFHLGREVLWSLRLSGSCVCYRMRWMLSVPVLTPSLPVLPFPGCCVLRVL